MWCVCVIVGFVYSYYCPEGKHLHSSVCKDSRWYSWYDHAVAWNRKWHCEAMVHSAAFWMEGKNPFGMDVAGKEADDSYKSREYAWTVAG